MKDFQMPLPDGARFILQRLRQAGREGYVVGGCVRDALLGLLPKDYDICTDAFPDEMQRIFADRRVIETGLQHGTLTVLCDGEPYEVTTYRIDGDYADHRHPDSVTFVRDLARDLARRDFTVNAMAYNEEKGLQDFYGGQNDLAARCIRCVGEPHRRFEEDALRILRALRFAATYGFCIEENTAAAARALCASLRFVAKERITVELCKLLCGDHAQTILEAHHDILLPVLPYALHVKGLRTVPAALAIRLAHVLQDAPCIDDALRCLRLDNATSKAVRELVALKDAPQPQDSIAWKLLLRDSGAERVRQLAAWKGWNTAILENILADDSCWNLKQLAVTGKDLIAAGIPAGKQVGGELERLLHAVITNALPNERTVLLSTLHEKKDGQ